MLDFIQSLLSRGMDIGVTRDQKLRISSPAKLTAADRAYLAANRNSLIELLRTSDQLSYLENGWHSDKSGSDRVILVKDGRLTESCIFNTPEAGAAFLVLIQHGYTSRQAFLVACAIERGEHDPIELERIAKRA